jgi:hypothetical protein
MIDGNNLGLIIGGKLLKPNGGNNFIRLNEDLKY